MDAYAESVKYFREENDGKLPSLKSLKKRKEELDSLIDDLSIYMQSTGRKYADHAATLRSWSARKKRQQKPGAGIPDYTYNKEESL